MTEFKLKVQINDGNETEYFWVTPFTITENGFTGKIANKPMVVTNVTLGQSINFTKSDISDWEYSHN